MPPLPTHGGSAYLIAHLCAFASLDLTPILIYIVQRREGPGCGKFWRR